MNDRDTLSALTDKVSQLRQHFPGRRIVVAREGFAAVFERCEIGKDGVMITATPIESGSSTLMIPWHPADYYLLVDEAQATE